MTEMSRREYKDTVTVISKFCLWRFYLDRSLRATTQAQNFPLATSGLRFRDGGIQNDELMKNSNFDDLKT